MNSPSDGRVRTVASYEKDTRNVHGKIVRYSYANRRPTGGRRGYLGPMLADLSNPLPPHELWVVEDQERWVRTGGYRQLYRTRRGRLPASLAHLAEGDTFVALFGLDLWANGLGGYITRARNVTRIERTNDGQGEDPAAHHSAG